MKCPICGEQLRTDEQMPGYALCDTCMKKFPISNAPKAKTEAPAKAQRDFDFDETPKKSRKSDNFDFDDDEDGFGFDEEDDEFEFDEKPKKQSKKSKKSSKYDDFGFDEDEEDDEEFGFDDDEFDFNSKKKKKGGKGGALKWVLIVLAVLLLAGGGFFGFKYYKGIQKAKADYKTNLESVMEYMLNGTSEAEDVSVFAMSVWFNASNGTANAETDPYTVAPKAKETDPVAYNTAEVALQNLYANETFIEKLNSITENKQNVSDLMSKLSDPPKGFEDAYTSLMSLYDVYALYTDLAMNAPTVTYEEYNTSKTTYADNFLTGYEDLQSKIPQAK